MGERRIFRDAAMAMEQAMQAFYVNAGEAVESPRLKEILGFLAQEEESHIRKIETLAAVEVDSDALDAAFHRAGDILDCFLVTPEHIQACTESLRNDEDVFTLAIRCEKNLILFYQTLKNELADGALRGQIDTLLDAEYEHLRKLFRLYNILFKGKARAMIP